jgi:hypothetical protein
MNKEEVLEKLKTHEIYFDGIDSNFKNDREIVLAAAINGHSIESAPEKFKSDDEVSSAAVKSNPGNLEYVDAIYQDDKSLVIDAVEKSGWVLKLLKQLLKMMEAQ